MASLDLAFFLQTGRTAKSVTEYILTLDLRNVALVPWNPILVSRVLFSLDTSGLSLGGSVTLLSDLGGLVSGVSGHVLATLWTFLQHL